MISSPAEPQGSAWHVWLAIRINIYAISLSTLWVPFDSVLLPAQIDQTVPEALRGSAVGLISLIGIGAAAAIQPIAGRMSDAAPLPDRRWPFIVGGTVLDQLCLVLIWLAPSFLLLLVAYVLLQLASNFAQAAFQAYIPDLVPATERGLASGVKNAFGVVGGVIGLLAVGLLFRSDARFGTAYIFIGAILALGAGLTVLAVPRVPPRPPDQRPQSWLALLSPRVVFESFAINVREHQGFILAVLVRFLFLLGIYPIQRFILFFLEDRFSVVRAVSTASFSLLGALVLGAVGAVGAGLLSDRFGRLLVLRVSVAVAVFGLASVAFSPSLIVLAITGSVLALGVGAFEAVNWALLSDYIPPGRGAQFFGLANIATAGASALAGLFGPMIDLLGRFLPAGLSFQLTFAVAALVALASFVPLRSVQSASQRSKAAPGQPDQPAE